MLVFFHFLAVDVFGWGYTQYLLPNIRQYYTLLGKLSRPHCSPEPWNHGFYKEIIPFYGRTIQVTQTSQTHDWEWDSHSKLWLGDGPTMKKEAFHSHGIPKGLVYFMENPTLKWMI